MRSSVLIAIALGLWACESVSAERTAKNNSITGVVVDSKTGRAVPRAEVCLYRVSTVFAGARWTLLQSRIADAHGEFVFYTPSNGPFGITSTSQGYLRAFAQTPAAGTRIVVRSYRLADALPQHFSR